MKLSIIAPIYKDSKLIPKFIERIKEQNSDDFELILVVDTNGEEVLESIDKNKDGIKEKLKVVYNSKRVGRQNALSSAFKVVEGEYIIFVSTSNQFDEKMVENINSLIDKNQTDIIEFKARAKKPFSFSGTQRKNFFKGVEIEKNPEVLAYSYPSEFNKVFKWEVLNEVYSHPLINDKINSRYSIEVVLRALTYAKTYSNSNKEIIRSKKELTSSFNPLKQFREWESVLKDPHFDKFHSEISYNFYFSSLLLKPPLVIHTKNKILLSKYKKKFNDFFKDSSFFKTNKYLLMNNKETEILKKNKNLINNKAYKEL